MYCNKPVLICQPLSLKSQVQLLQDLNFNPFVFAVLTLFESFPASCFNAIVTHGNCHQMDRGWGAPQLVLDPEGHLSTLLLACLLDLGNV